ncbi:MAG: hypothetical protein HY306_03470 [Nitrosomonadales bacterium]|nr:hypothetical protein [Nitrosomonadales bacterium]
MKLEFSWKMLVYPERMRQHIPLLLVLISAVLAVAAYMQAIDYPFISDDTVYITKRLEDLQFTRLWQLFIEPYNAFSEILPLRDISYWLDLTLFGWNPLEFRMHNILLYLLCLPLVYLATTEVWKYFRPEDRGVKYAAAIVTALFAIHSAHVEAVVWISGRKDILAGVFSLLALWLSMRARREPGLSPRYAAAALVALLAAILSKAVAVAVAPVIALLWILFRKDISTPHHTTPHHTIQVLLWPLACLFLAACMATFFSANSAVKLPFYFGTEAVTRTLAIFGWMARLAISPESRHFIYPVLDDPRLFIMVAVGLVVLLSAMIGMALVFRKRSLAGFALLAFALFCLPYAQLLPFSTPSLVADRFLFLAVWPVMLLLVSLAWRLSWKMRNAVMLAVAIAIGFQTAVRPGDWRSGETLTHADFSSYPWYYYIATQKIMFSLWPQGAYGEAGKVIDGIADADFRKLTTELSRAHQMVRSNSGSADELREVMGTLWGLGAILNNPPDRAKWNPPLTYVWRGFKENILTDEWMALSDRFPADAAVQYNAGIWLLSNDRYQEAVPQLRMAAESPTLPEYMRGTVYKNFGLALSGVGDIGGAEKLLGAALEQSPPDMRASCMLADIYRQANQLAESARAGTICNRTRNEQAGNSDKWQYSH